GGDVFRLKGGLGGEIEGFDVGPFEADDVEGEALLLASPLRMLAKPGFKPAAEVAESKGGGRAIDKVSLGHGVEFFFAENGAKAGKVFLHGSEDAPPVLAIVEFEAFERGEAVVGLDEARRVTAHVAHAGNATLHVVAGCERSHDRASHLLLDGGELHTAF